MRLWRGESVCVEGAGNWCKSMFSSLAPSSFLQLRGRQLRSHLIFSGCYLLLLRSLLQVLADSGWMNLTPQSRQHMIVTGVFCNVAVWCETLGYSLILGTLCVQLWRLYHIFNHFRVKHYYLSDQYLASFVVCLIALDLTVLIIWIAMDPLLPRFELHTVEYFDNQLVFPIRGFCYSQHLSIHYPILWGINILGSVCVVMLSTLNRHISHKHFNSTVSVNVMVYIGNVLSVLCTVISFIVEERNIHYAYILRQICFLSVVFLVCMFIFLPKIFTNVQRRRLQLTYQQAWKYFVSPPSVN